MATSPYVNARIAVYGGIRSLTLIAVESFEEQAYQQNPASNVLQEWMASHYDAFRRQHQDLGKQVSGKLIRNPRKLQQEREDREQERRDQEVEQRILSLNARQPTTDDRMIDSIFAPPRTRTNVPSMLHPAAFYKPTPPKPAFRHPSSPSPIFTPPAHTPAVVTCSGPPQPASIPPIPHRPRQYANLPSASPSANNYAASPPRGPYVPAAPAAPALTPQAREPVWRRDMSQQRDVQALAEHRGQALGQDSTPAPSSPRQTACSASTPLSEATPKPTNRSNPSQPAQPSIPGIPEDIQQLACAIRKIGNSRFFNKNPDMPQRKSLKEPPFREHFYASSGALRPTSPLWEYRGDERLFSKEAWEYLLGPEARHTWEVAEREA
ncbi:hypothetical protein LTR37_004945 [Vermiconidia calcicola]|uniref:Uncharacterized protein n=1 Tax=Vermiconidia calcicola TaxID=1690605 RepID=A0ACC3NL68_9PEZI|nr:hypothetical protein LTR37_004945 [Vermiconidia calcicola]